MANVKQILQAYGPRLMLELMFLTLLVMSTEAVRTDLAADGNKDAATPDIAKPDAPTQSPKPEKSTATLVVERIFQALAIASNIALQLSPMRVILEIRRYKDTKGSDGLPYLMIMCVASQWCVYAIYSIWCTGNSSMQVLIFANILGAILGSFYVYSFQKNCNDQVRATKMKYFYKFTALVTLVQFILVICLSQKDGMFMLGLVGSVLSIGCTASPMTELGQILKTRDCSIWPADFIYVNCGGLIIWLVTGLLLGDPWVIIPNAVGLGICLFQIGVLYAFGGDLKPKRRLRKEEMTFHVIDETAPIFNVDAKLANQKGFGQQAGEDYAPAQNSGARVMW